jgi:predicted DNA binding CopG/RHH family protein
MKKPNPKNLKLNKAKTDQIRSTMAQNKSVKITINIEAETLAKLKAMAEESGVPYQRLLNRTLSEGLTGKSPLESRIKKMEKELKALKKQIAA